MSGCSNGVCFITPHSPTSGGCGCGPSCGCDPCKEKHGHAAHGPPARNGCGPRATSALEAFGVRGGRGGPRQARPTPLPSSSMQVPAQPIGAQPESHVALARIPAPMPERKSFTARLPEPEPVIRIVLPAQTTKPAESVIQRPVAPVAPSFEPLTTFAKADALALMPPIAPASVTFVAPVAPVAPKTSGSAWPSPPRNRRLPASYAPSGDLPPPVLVPSELAGRVTQTEWAEMPAASRASISTEIAAGRLANATQEATVAAAAARQRLLAGIGQGLSEAGRQVGALINSVNAHALDTRREDHTAEASQREHQTAMYQAETARMLVTLQAQQQAANAAGNGGASSQLADMIAALRASQQQLVVAPPLPAGMDNTTKALIAAAVAAAAIAAAVVLRRPQPRYNPSPARRAPVRRHPR